MHNSAPHTLTLDEAVARLVNLRHLPIGSSLDEMLEAFSEEAEFELEYAWAALPSEAIELCQSRLEICRLRAELARALAADIELSLEASAEQRLKPLKELSSGVRLSIVELDKWASDRFGLDVPEWLEANEAPKSVQKVDADSLPTHIEKEDVEPAAIRKLSAPENSKSESVALLSNKNKKLEELLGLFVDYCAKRQSTGSSAVNYSHLAKLLQPDAEISGKDKNQRLRKLLKTCYEARKAYFEGSENAKATTIDNATEIQIDRFLVDFFKETPSALSPKQK